MSELLQQQTLRSPGRPAVSGCECAGHGRGYKAKLEDMSRYFPPGMKVVYPYDTTPFIKVAIEEVVKTLFEAILLVFLVMYLFLGNIRATLIPTIAVPVVLLGTFAILGVFGFSINMLTMFAMVLAIGLLVDDAIVVVENVERIMRDEGLSPREATAEIYGRDYQCPDRNRVGALGRIRSHGFFWRFNRCHLPPVFRDNYLFDASFSGRCLDPNASPLCITSQAHSKRA